jgi:CRISPR-associated endonuclease/helicase Cas3
MQADEDIKELRAADSPILEREKGNGREKGLLERPFWAHRGHGERQGQPLLAHLVAVAERAREFAEPFGGGEWAYLAGLWHDLGKYSLEFQAYLEESACNEYHDAELRGTVDHASAGAQHALATMPVLGHMLAHAVAGHHAGLLDTISTGPSLDARTRKHLPAWDHGLSQLPPVSAPALPAAMAERLKARGRDPEGVGFSLAFFTRMLFSCLVDADFLDTEAFLDPPRAAERPRWPSDALSRMEAAVTSFVERLAIVGTAVDEQRQQVRAACLEAARGEPGFFSLTVPTGGGKTLSSLAFALRHCSVHGLRRVVYVVPFTSIIEQNADVFRAAFQPLVEAGLPDLVIEHHSAADVENESAASRLAAENWDAPLIVTTTVQFYESLFANRPSRCRKLHNLARAVIILDEVQRIPVDYLAPCLAALKELVARYGATVVLCTATQPAVHRREGFELGLEDVREIVPEPRRLYFALRRVRLEYLGSVGDDDLVERLTATPRVLCIVNTRGHARELFGRIQDSEGAYHLSAAMCPQHRSEVLAEIRHDLHAGRPCRVVTTPLVEAGVDIDFPVVYRSLAGLDSVAQAAGRCNRNGREPVGTLFLFSSEHTGSERFLRDTSNVTVQLLGGENSRPLYEDLLSLDAMEHYFRLYYWDQKQRWDAKGILGEFTIQHDRRFPLLFGFQSCADRFHLIEESGRPVIVPWHERGKQLCHELRRPRQLPSVSLLRAIQRFTVQIPVRQWLAEQGRTIELVHERFPVLVSLDPYYDERLGLVLDRQDIAPDMLVI